MRLWAEHCSDAVPCSVVLRAVGLERWPGRETFVLGLPSDGSTLAWLGFERWVAACENLLGRLVSSPAALSGQPVHVGPAFAPVVGTEIGRLVGSDLADQLGHSGVAVEPRMEGLFQRYLC